MFRNFLEMSASSGGMTTTYANTSIQTVIGFKHFQHSESTSVSISNARHPSTSRSSLPSISEHFVRPNHQVIRTPIYDPKWTTTTDSTATSQRSSVLLSVVEGRGRARGVIGLAAIDLYNPVFTLSQFTDNTNYESLKMKLQVFNPFEVIIPNSMAKEDNHLYETLREFLPKYYIKFMDRKHFNESIGLEMIGTLRCDDFTTVEIQLKSQYYSLSASAALFKYIETYEHIIYAPKSVKVVFESADNTMTIDPKTAQLLELIVNLNDPKSDQTLFGVINKTKTRCGYRLLRSNILQPSTDLSIITARQQMVEEIISSQNLFQSLETILSQFTAIEIERIISLLIQINRNDSQPSVKAAERKIESIIALKHIISLIEPLIQVLKYSENNVFEEYIAVLIDPRFQRILDDINETILESCKYTKGALNMKLEKCHAIKRGFNALLDMARNAYSEMLDDISHMIDAYGHKYSIPIKSVYTTGRGFYMQINFKNQENSNLSLPNEFIRVNRKNNCFTFTTQELIHKNNRVNSSVEEIILMSDVIITELIAKIRQFVGCLYNLSEVLAKIDLVFSFAYQCSIGNYIRPDFTQYLAIKQGRHPILEKLLNRQPVPNDTILSIDSNFMIITGPNMSGKTTLLKQVAILQVMAQIGSYIPAEFASFRMCDRLFSRIGNNDEIETNSSTFMVEMREISYVLKNITENSLVIIDELGRGTGVEEGVGLCYALCEHLLQTKAFVLFVTHFIELTKLENHFLNVSNCNFGVEHSTIDEPNNDSYNFTHILKPGVTEELYYGLRLANLTKFNPKILQKAHEFAEFLSTIQNNSIISERMNPIKKLRYKLCSMLMSVTRNGQIPDTQTLKEMKTYFKNEIQKCNPSEDLENDFSLI